MARGIRVYVGKPSAADKLAIAAACEKLIAEVLRPRFLPEIRPTQFNYPISISGKWHGNKYRPRRGKPDSNQTNRRHQNRDSGTKIRGDRSAQREHDLEGKRIGILCEPAHAQKQHGIGQLNAETSQHDQK